VQSAKQTFSLIPSLAILLKSRSFSRRKKQHRSVRRMPTPFVQANNYSEAICAGAFRRLRDEAAQDALGVYFATEGCEVELRRGVRIGRAQGGCVATPNTGDQKGCSVADIDPWKHAKGQ
jgi:hypothetical protein